MAQEYMKQLPDDGQEQIFIADGAYNSDALEKIAPDKNVKVQTTSLTGKAPEDIVADFVLNGEGTEILFCPCKKEPTSCKYNPNNGYVTATMPDNCLCILPTSGRMQGKDKQKEKQKHCPGHR